MQRVRVARHSIAFAAVTFAAVLVAGQRTVEARALDPLPSGSLRPVSLNPFRVADAQPAAPAPAPPPAPSTTAPPPAPKPLACTRDEECPAENICQNGTCQAIQQRTNILYLYYREGSFLEVLGLYWSKRAPTGYNVLVPFYWHFWSPQDRSRVVAPFFWRFEDFAARRTLTVIVPGLPVSWSSQPDAQSFGIWPLFYKSTKFGWAAPLLGSFTVADPDHGEWTGALAYLYWWKRTPKKSWDVFFPLFVSSRTPQSAWGYAVPLNFYWRDKDDANLLALPVFYWNRHKNGSSLYAITGYHTREGPESSGSLFWLYWFGANQTDKSRYDVLFPLIWAFQSPSATSVVAPPIFHFRRAEWHLSTLLPVWWTGGDDKKGESFKTLLPLFYWSTSEHGKKALLLVPLGGYSRDDVEGSHTLALFPFIFSRTDREGSLSAITPLFIRFWNKKEGSTTNLAAFIAYWRDDPRGSSSVLFPVYWHYRDRASGATATALFPIFAHRSGPSDDSTAIGAAVIWAYKRSFHDGGWSAGLFPLLFAGHRGDASHLVLFPLLWHFGSAKSSVTALLPLFYTHENRHGSDTAILPLLTFFGDNDGDKYRIQFPLLWRFIDTHEQTTTTVTPAGFYRSTRDGYSLGIGPLVPIVYAGSSPGRSHFAIAPLFWRFHDDAQQSTTTVVLNFMHRTRGGETTDALFPLVYWRRGARPGGSDETSFTLFPLVHYRRDARSRLVLSPLGAASREGDRDMGFVGPYFWYKKPGFEASGIPFLHADITDAATGDHTRQYGPYITIDGPGRKSRVLFPLVGRYDDALEHDTYVFPTYFRQRKTDGYELDTFLPLFWRSKWQGRTTTIVGPWYDRSGPGVHDTGLAPLYFYAKNDERSITVIPPLLLFRQRDFKADTETLFALLAYHTRDHDTSSTVIFPLWWAGREKARSHRVLFPIYWAFADTDAKTELNIAGPFFWTRNDTWRTRGLLPVAWYSRNSADGAGSNAVLPLFYEYSGPNHFTFLTLLGGYSKQPTSTTWYAGIIASSEGPQSSFRMLFPLWFSHVNKTTETTTRIIPPLLHVSRTTPETSISTWLALYWHRRTIVSETRLVLPLYYDVHDFHQSRTTVLFPLLFRRQNDETQTTSWLAPLFYRGTDPTGTSTVLFPLYWSFDHGQDQTTVLFPLYAHWRRQTYQATYIFPTFYYREGLGPKGPDGTWRKLFFPLWESAVKRPGDYMWEVLGGLFGRESIGRNRYLKILFMTFETQAPAHTTTSWYSQPARAPRKEALRGLSANVW